MTWRPWLSPGLLLCSRRNSTTLQNRCSAARRTGTVCTSCDGDQHGALKHLIDEVRGWAFEWVRAGNIKGFLERSSGVVISFSDLRGLGL